MKKWGGLGVDYRLIKGVSMSNRHHGHCGLSLQETFGEKVGNTPCLSHSRGWGYGEGSWGTYPPLPPLALCSWGLSSGTMPAQRSGVRGTLTRRVLE